MTELISMVVCGAFPLFKVSVCLLRQILCYLWLDVQDGDHALDVDLPDGLQPGAVHGVLVAAVLQVVVVADVLHHLVVGHKVVVLPVLLVLLRRPSCV